MHRHTLFGVNPIAIHDLPPPLPPIIANPLPSLQEDDSSSIASSRANSVQPFDFDEAKRLKLDRFGRQARERTSSPDPRTIKKKSSGKRAELPAVIMDFLAALPPA